MGARSEAAEQGGGNQDRLSADQRREALLDIAFDLLGEGGADGVTMGTVAERAEVTRTLVYKHFANRNDLLAALYRREASRLDRAIRVRVIKSPEGFESRLRALVRASMEAIDTHGPVFMPLQAFATNATVQAEQRAWDNTTVAYYGELAAEEFGLRRTKADAAVAVLLSGLHILLRQAGHSPTAHRRRYLEDFYVEMVIGALSALADGRPPVHGVEDDETRPGSHRAGANGTRPEATAGDTDTDTDTDSDSDTGTDGHEVEITDRR